LGEQAIKNAQLVFEKLPNGDALFQKCISSDNGVETLAKELESRCAAHNKRRPKLLRQFEKSSAWLRNFSTVVDIVVQTEAGIGCPIWAPIKLILMVK
jgi:hypothetical protein